MDANPALASWLVAQRLPIEQSMRHAMGPAAPRASGGEAETLRRFRSFTSVALHRGELRAPALDGLQTNERRMAALLDAWLAAACQLAGPDAEDVRQQLAPLVEQFRQALRQTSSGRTARGKPRAARRAVVAAIDRIADGFLAIDTVSGTIADANPAAGALLGTARDTLLGVDFDSFVPEDARTSWQTRLDSMAEGGDHERFVSTLRDVSGELLPVEVSLTAYPTRGRTLALALCHPVVTSAATQAAHQGSGDAPRSGAAPAPMPAIDPVAHGDRPVDAPAPVGFARLSDGKAIPRRSASQLRRRPTDAGRRSVRDAPTRPQPPPPGTPPPGSRS